MPLDWLVVKRVVVAFVPVAADGPVAELVAELVAGRFAGNSDAGAAVAVADAVELQLAAARCGVLGLELELAIEPVAVRVLLVGGFAAGLVVSGELN